MIQLPQCGYALPRQGSLVMSDPLIDEIAQRYQAIHRHDPPAVGEHERQAAIVFNGLQRVILELVYQSVQTTTLETALFFHWLRLATLNQGLDEALFRSWSRDMGSVMQSVVSALKASAADVADDGPSEEMRVLGDKVQQLRDRYRELNQQPLPPRAELVECLCAGQCLDRAFGRRKVKVCVEDGFVYRSVGLRGDRFHFRATFSAGDNTYKCALC